MNHKNGKENIDDDTIEAYRKRFLEAINDDLNVPLAMGIIWEIVRNEKKTPQIANLLLEFDKVLALDLVNSENYMNKQNNVNIPEEILELLEKRKRAREEKNWNLSDQIRDEIRKRGYIVKDTKEGMTVEKMPLGTEPFDITKGVQR